MDDPLTMELRELDRMLRNQPRSLYGYNYCPDSTKTDYHLKNLIMKGDLARTEVYLRNGASPNPKTILWKKQWGHKNDWFPILWAADSGKVEMVELLLEFGADVNAKGGLSEKTSLSASLLVFDCRRAHTALRAAVEKQNVDIVRKLLSAGACPESYQHHYGSAKSRASRDAIIFCDIPVLYEAVVRGNVPIAELLLAGGAKANLPKTYKLPYSYLTEAVRIESPELVALLLEFGADPNFEVPHLGTTPLMMAVKASKHALEMSRLLIQHGAKVNGHERLHRKVNALTIAVASKDLQLVRLLLDAGAKADSIDSNPLAAAVAADSPTSASAAIADLLINRGAQVNGCDTSGEELLFRAVQKQNLATAGILLNRGAVPDVVHGDMTPLKQAVLDGHVEMIRMLLNYGASPTARVFAPNVVSRGRQICCSALQFATECSASPSIISILSGSEGEEREPVPSEDGDEKQQWHPTISESSDQDSMLDSANIIALCDVLMDTTASPRAPEVQRTLSRAVLCITWALCHQPGRSSYCEWQLVTPELDANTVIGSGYQLERREPMSGGVIIARGRTRTSFAKVADGGSITADWHNDGFKLSTGVILDDTANLKALVVTQGRQRSLRSCELHFKVKTEGGLLSGSKVVGEAWFPLSHLQEDMPPGTTAKFLVQLEDKKQKKRTGTLAFELTY